MLLASIEQPNISIKYHALADDVLEDLLELVRHLGAAHGGGTPSHEHGTRGSHPDGGSNHRGWNCRQKCVYKEPSTRERNGNERDPAREERGGAGYGVVGRKEDGLYNGNFSVELLKVPGERPLPSHVVRSAARADSARRSPDSEEDTHHQATRTGRASRPESLLSIRCP